MIMPQGFAPSLLESIIQRLAAAGIELQVTKKRVKNINFRLKPYTLMVSVPLSISTKEMAQVLDKRVAWAIDSHPQVLAQYERRQQHGQLSTLNPSSVLAPVMLWGERQSLTLNNDETLIYYRQQLSKVTPALFDKWQPIVGADANEVRIKKMHSRWGSCNTRARRIWLSVYLPAYPIECTEYVIVHELCHLHHANHSRAFWQTVATAMPEYQQWHDRLVGKTGQLD
ncbi:M48 family metallopeptidase [Psychrobacter frigidicola]|uniref:M48 family metallopeptidase n=1 Tax=Psychrobacter frigidicola TaxID=45611 RepID=A0A5C7A1Q5_9GAMM|nr:M48 family metallopeptidase [Psychrobacter frigidicola]TXD96414.1 M48 family metallopeptidase [Psychrobacter frigidicola]